MTLCGHMESPLVYNSLTTHSLHRVDKKNVDKDFESFYSKSILDEKNVASCNGNCFIIFYQLPEHFLFYQLYK